MLKESVDEEAKIIGMLRMEVKKKTKGKETLETARRDAAFDAATAVYEKLGGDFENVDDWDWEFSDPDLQAKVFDVCAKVNKAFAKEGRWWAH